MKPQSSLNKVLKNAGVLLSGNMAANILGFISLAIFTQSQGAVIFGYYVLFLTFIEIIDKIFNFQTWQAFIKFATDFQVKNEKHNVVMLLKYSFLVDFISLMVATLVAFVLSFYAVEFFEIPQEFHPLLLFMTLTILFRSVEISTGIFRLFDEFKIQAKITFYAAAFKLILYGLLASKVSIEPSFEAFVYAAVFSQFITMIMKFVYAKKILNKNEIKLIDIIKEKINMPLMKELKIFSFVIYKNFSVSIRLISRQLDVVILGKLYSPEIVGIYKIAKEVANLIAKLTDPIYQAIYPEFAKLIASARKVEAYKMAINISIYSGLSALVFYILFIIFGKWGIPIAFGQDFIGAYEITLIYYIAILIAILSLPLVPLMDSIGLVKYTFRNQFYATVIYIIVVYPLISEYGAIGAGITYIIYYLSWSIMAIIRLHINNKLTTREV